MAMSSARGVGVKLDDIGGTGMGSVGSVGSEVEVVEVVEVAEVVETKEKPSAQDTQQKELPVTMLIPIVVLGLGILLLGILNEPIVTNILQYALPGGGL